MKTDQERFLELMQDFGVELDTPDTKQINESSFDIYVDRCEKIIGYYGFVASFTFDENGKFKTVGIWE